MGILICRLNAVLDAPLASIRRDGEPGEFNRQRRLSATAMARRLNVTHAIHRPQPRLEPSPIGGSSTLPQAALETSVTHILSGT